MGTVTKPAGHRADANRAWLLAFLFAAGGACAQGLPANAAPPTNDPTVLNTGTIQAPGELPVAVPAPAPAAAAAPAVRAWNIVPQLRVEETWSDNLGLDPQAFAKRGFITDLSPALLIEHTGAHASLFVDYRRHDFRYSEDSSRLNNGQNFLDSSAKVEAIENFLFVDARANITQQNRSAFGAASSPNSASPNDNRVETDAYQVSPYIRGRISDAASWQLRYNATEGRTDDPALPATRSNEWIGWMKSSPGFGRLGWSLDARAQNMRNDLIGSRDDTRLRATGIYEITSQMHASIIGGRERSDFLDADKKSTSIVGVGFDWQPTDRTQFAAIKEHRFFGDGYNVYFTHRTPLTSWRLTSTRDVTNLPSLLTSADPGSVYNLLFDLLASSVPDPVARAEAVRRRLEDTGLPASATVSGGFLTARPILDRGTEASVALTGVLNTITLTYTRHTQRGLGLRLAGVDSFSLSDDIRQQVANASWVYRVSPLTSLTMSGYWLHTEGISVDTLDSRQRAVNVFITTQLGPRTQATLGARHVRFDDSLNTGFRENAVLGAMSVRF